MLIKEKWTDVTVKDRIMHILLSYYSLTLFPFLSYRQVFFVLFHR